MYKKVQKKNLDAQPEPISDSDMIIKLFYMYKLLLLENFQRFIHFINVCAC